MGRRGPKPMPTALKLATGVASHHKLNGAEPQFEPPASMRPPKGLRPAAKREWKRLAGDLVAKGVLTEADLSAFRVYCVLWGDMLEYEALIAKVGEEEAVSLGYRRTLDQIRSRYAQQAARFGLDPSSRSAIKAVPVSPGAKESNRERFFGGAKSA